MQKLRFTDLKKIEGNGMYRLAAFNDDLRAHSNPDAPADFAAHIR